MMGVWPCRFALVIISQDVASIASRYWSGIVGDFTCTSWVQLLDVIFVTVGEMHLSHRDNWVEGRELGLKIVSAEAFVN